MKDVAFGNLSKMRSRLNSPVDYELVFGSETVPLNELVGQSIQLKFSGNIFCSYCGRKTKKSYSQGFCFPCMRKLARCDSCIMSPEKCHYSKGTCREPEWGETNCMIPHYVYLANSSGIKVGITRNTQVPQRWIDQGAIQALPIFEAGTRRMSGLMESLFRSLITDRTNWRKMLKGEVEQVDMLAARDQLYAELDAQLEGVIQTAGDVCEKLPEAKVVDIEYPVIEYPVKITSLNPEKEPLIAGELRGIKGQYLILDTGCINVRKFTSYEATLSC